MDQEKIGKFIAKLRKDKNLTQEELAAKLGVSNKSVSRWETGVNMPDLAMFPQLSRELNVSINDLMSGEIIDQNEYQEKLENNIVDTIAKVDQKNKITNRLIIIILVTVIVCLVISFLLNTINVKLKYDEDRMYLENHQEYGLRFINKNSCTVYSGNIDYIKVNTLINNEKTNVIFISAKCTIPEIIKYNNSTGLSIRALNFDFDDETSEYKYKFYYTDYSLKDIKKANEVELDDIISKSYLLSEKE